MRHLVTILFFIAAIAAYLAGSAPGAIGLVVVGLVLEVFAWRRVFRRRKQPAPSTR